MTAVDDRPARAQQQAAEELANAPAVPDETLYERRMQALSLRNSGMVFSQIASIQGISPAVARYDVEWAKREVMTASLEDIIATQRAVILDLRRASYPAALNHQQPEDQARAQSSIMKGLEQEAKLVGAYAPVRTVGVPTETEFGARFMELVSLIRPDTLKELMRGYTQANPAAAALAGGAAHREHGRPDAATIEGEVIEPSPFDSVVATPVDPAQHVEADARPVGAAERPDASQARTTPAPPEWGQPGDGGGTPQLGHCRECGERCDGQHVLAAAAEQAAAQDDGWANV